MHEVRRKEITSARQETHSLVFPATGGGSGSSADRKNPGAALQGKLLRTRLIETEAYLGPDDLASHAAKGRTRRTEVLFGAPGRAYVYLIYGQHEMLNVVAGATGQGQGVLIRAADPLDGWKADLSGPGRLTRALQITRLQNGLDVTRTELYFLDDPDDRPAVQSTKRIGIDYVLHWKDAPCALLTQNRINVPAPM